MSAQSTAISHFTVYSAAPDDDSFYSTSLDGPVGIYGSLREILAELDRVDPTQCPGDLYREIAADLTLLRDTVIPAAERGGEVLVAHDEDGYYFARRSEPSQTFAVLVPCQRDAVEDDDGIVLSYEPCPDASGIHHAHVSEMESCGCGAVVVLEGALTEGDDPPFYRARSANGEWTVRCPGCGAEHVLVGRDA